MIGQWLGRVVGNWLGRAPAEQQQPATTGGGRKRPKRLPLNLIYPAELPVPRVAGVISAQLDDWTGAIAGTVIDSQTDVFLTLYSKVA
jgi:hypothetical protein